MSKEQSLTGRKVWIKRELSRFIYAASAQSAQLLPYLQRTARACRGSSGFLFSGGSGMPLFEIETDAHIIITWAGDEDAARGVVKDAYPNDKVIRMTKRPRDTWVISKAALGLNGRVDVCNTARDCLSKAHGDKVHAIRLYMHETGTDLERARKVIESNMVMGW
jgi:hypothetical protein